MTDQEKAARAQELRDRAAKMLQDARDAALATSVAASRLAQRSTEFARWPYATKHDVSRIGESLTLASHCTALLYLTIGDYEVAAAEAEELDPIDSIPF